MSLHGHTKIELTDVHTGAVETIEKDNIVTNAVSEIFNGYGGRFNIEKFLCEGETNTGTLDSLLAPFYGGLLLYNKALGNDPNTVFAPADAGITGCAVYDVINTGTNTVRGSCNKTETKIDNDNGVATFVYDFATNQGNGVIASVCLTSLLGGYFSETPGITGTSDNSNNRNYLVDSNSIFQPYSELFPSMQGGTLFTASGILLYVDSEQDKAVFGKLTQSGTTYTLTISEYSAGLKEIDLFRNKKAPLPLKKFVDFDVTSIISSNSTKWLRFCCDAELGMFYLVSTRQDNIAPNKTFNVREFDMSTYEFKDYTITNTTEDTFFGTMTYSGGYAFLNGRVYGGDIYMTAGNRPDSPTKIYRINLGDSNNVIQIDMSGTTMGYVHDVHHGRMYQYGLDGNWASVILNTKDNKLYTTEATASYDYVSGYKPIPTTIPVIGESVTSLVTRYAGNNSSRIHRSLRRNYLATINDLPKAVEKTADKTMKVTYTLRRGE